MKENNLLIAQLVEQVTVNHQVEGSSPSKQASAGIAQSVEQLICN